jgi:trans-2,3-dihydro-3-hydroxyanthranilate isomerase
VPDQHVRFYFVDVFTTQPLSGNPLVVVTGGQALAFDTMQRIAREFNQSETTFILDPTRKDADWKLRSVTATGVEVFGAGHNALGAWWWLAESGQLRQEAGRHTFMQEIGEHVLPVEIAWDAGRPVSVAMTQGQPVNGRIVEDVPGLARALGLEPGDLVTERVPAQVVSTGAPHLLVPVRSCDAVDRVRANADALLAVLQAVHGQGCYVFSLDARSPDADAYARFFNPTLGIVEDPGTGSAAGPLACHLAAHGITQRDRVIAIEQGHARGRRSLIQARVTGTAVQVSGACATVAEGILKSYSFRPNT